VRSSSQARRNALSSIAKPQAASSKHAKQQQSAASKQKQQPRAMSGLVPQACRDGNCNDGVDTKVHSTGACLAEYASVGT
jgi:hypothetical protein